MSILTYENGGDVVVSSIESKPQIIKGINVDVNSSSTNKLRAASLMEQMGINTSAPVQGSGDKQKLIDHALTQKNSFETYSAVSDSLTNTIVAIQIAKELSLNSDRVLSNGGVSLDADLTDMYNQKLDVLDVPNFCNDRFPMHRVATQLDVDEEIADEVGEDLFGTFRAQQYDVDNGLAVAVDDLITIGELDGDDEVRPSALLLAVKTNIFLPKLVTIATKKASMLDSEMIRLVMDVCESSFKTYPIVPDLTDDENVDWNDRFVE